MARSNYPSPPLSTSRYHEDYHLTWVGSNRIRKLLSKTEISSQGWSEDIGARSTLIVHGI